MQTLAGIDTKQVYHEFSFDCDQVKDLKLQQYFIHVDVVNWFEKILANRYWAWNFIKIIYKKLHHFHINHVKCVEIYYDKHDSKRFQYFKSEMDQLIEEAQNQMPWRSKTIYYVCREIKSRKINLSNKLRIEMIEIQLQTMDLYNCLTTRYEMEIDWCNKQYLTVYEFKPNLNEDQLKSLDDIFVDLSANPQIFISKEFMFLKNTEPPSVLYSLVLTIYQGQFLSSLTLEDILSLELANKDYRLEWYSCVLDHDIQMHLQKRFNLFYKNEQLETYDASIFTNVRLLKYFLYKYQDCFTTIVLPNHILRKEAFNLIVDEQKSIKFRGLNNFAIRYDIKSPENIIVCSVTVLRHNEGNLLNPDCIISKKIRLDKNIKFRLGSKDILETTPCFIEIKICANYTSVCLTDFLHNVLYKNNRFRDGSIIQLRSYNNRIKSCILNSFVDREYKFEIIFKNIIFDFKRLVDWFSKRPKLTKVSFTDCIFLLSDKHSKMLEIMMKKKKFTDCCDLALTFRNMKLDKLIISILLHINRGDIIYDGCCLTPSSSAIIPPKSEKCIVCINMKIDLQVLIPLLPHFSFYFPLNCQIQSNHDTTLQVDSITEPSRNNAVILKNMDIDAEVLLKISEYICEMKLYRCRILSNEIVNIPSNYPTTDGFISMNYVEIELKAAAKIFNRFKNAHFYTSRFVCTDLPTPEIPVKSISDLVFGEISITPEFIKALKYLNFHRYFIFSDCKITNQNLVEIWAATPRCKCIAIANGNLVDYNFYFELVAKIYENRLDEMLHELKDGITVPFIDLFYIAWSDNPLIDRDIDWQGIKIRSVFVNDWTIQLEYTRNGQVLDLFNEQNSLLNDTDICEVDYY